MDSRPWEEIARHRVSKRHYRNMLRHSGNQVVACEEVSEYRDAVLALVGKEDIVLEVGSHVGGTTKAGRDGGQLWMSKLYSRDMGSYSDSHGFIHVYNIYRLHLP